MIPDIKALWESMEIVKPDLFAQPLAAIKAARARYLAVSSASGVPWEVIGALHQRECGGNFNQHLHNGDPLSARTVDVPRGRPALGSPPFSWEESAQDALAYDGLADQTWWGDLPTVLYRIERYNGLGYRSHGILSPYIWAGTNHYTVGKYGDDGHFDPSLVDKQPGCAGLLLLLGYGRQVATTAPPPQAAADQPGLTVTPEFGPPPAT